MYLNTLFECLTFYNVWRTFLRSRKNYDVFYVNLRIIYSRVHYIIYLFVYYYISHIMHVQILKEFKIFIFAENVVAKCGFLFFLK